MAKRIKRPAQPTPQHEPTSPLKLPTALERLRKLLGLSNRVPLPHVLRDAADRLEAYEADRQSGWWRG